MTNPLMRKGVDRDTQQYYLPVSEISCQRIHPCCVSFLPDLCLPKYLDFFDHENKCQAGIQFTELELKPADDNRKERKTKSAEYSQLNAS